MKSLKRHLLVAIPALVGALSFLPARADGSSVSIGYQPMVSTGLAAKQPFEAWVVFDRSADPAVPGYAVPAGATMRLTFPKEFTPSVVPPHLEGALLYGWPQGAVPVPFTVTQNESDPRVVVVRINEAIPIGPPERPGLKAIHVRTGELNPAAAGDYPIAVQLINAGSLSGTFNAVARITNRPVPTVAAINQLHQGKNEDWQHVKPGAEASLPIDFLVTLPDVPRSSISVTPTADGSLGILSDGKPIGLIKTQGVPIELRPEAFGPGYSRLGIFRIRAKAGIQSGTAEIIASLDGGTQYKITLVVE